MHKALRGVLAALALGASSVAAQAADLGAIKGPPPAPMLVDTYQPFQIRLRATAVVPDTGGLDLFNSKSAIAGNNDTLTLIGVAPYPFGPVPGANSSVSWSVIPEVDVSYYLTKNFAIEAICCLSHHSVQGVGIIRDAGVAKTWVFPPSLIFQYHFTNFGAFQPYLGVGVNFTTYFGTTPQGNYFPLVNFNQALGTPYVPAQIIRTYISPSWGVVGQVGFDYMLNEHWGINVDLKRIQMEGGAQTQFFSPFAGGTVVPTTAKVKINPWIVGAGVTYRFGNGLVKPLFGELF
jgi:outer membrane protein